MPLDADLADRIARAQERIARAATRAGRDASSVRIVVATKTFPPETLRSLASAGLSDFGENRVQEATAKTAALADLPITWHFIGRLQTNKARSIPGRFVWLHSLDNVRLGEILSRRAGAVGATVRCLVEVNVSGEAAKGGIPPETLDGLLDRTRDWPALSVEGLMTIAPWGASDATARSVFARLRELARARGLAELSMGMSDDYTIAVEEGATMVRLGRSILGERPSGR